MATDRDVPERVEDATPGAPAGDTIDAATAGARDGAPRVVTSESLLNGATQLAILHDRKVYYLRQTRYGKLILTK